MRGSSARRPALPSVGTAWPADNGMTQRQILMQQQIMILKMQRGGYGRGGRIVADQHRAGQRRRHRRRRASPRSPHSRFAERVALMVQPNDERDAVFSLEVTSEPG